MAKKSRFTESQLKAMEEHKRWLEKYLPVERQIIEAREKRLENAEKRKRRRRIQFADLCEATGGLAVAWRRDGASVEEMLAYANGDRWVLQCLMPFLRQSASKSINRMQHKLVRPLYYERENARRRQLAAERRKIRKRHTENPCPTRDMILDAWVHAKDGRDAMIRFGSLLEDLECYIDNELHLSEGMITGRGPGIKGWLKDNIPALSLRYTTVMRYKATARKLRQIVELKDPIPLSALLISPNDGEKPTAGGKNVSVCEMSGKSGEDLNVRDENYKVLREVRILRARAIMNEALGQVPDVVTRMMARINDLLDPDKIENEIMLRSWIDKYSKEIVPKTKKSWLRRLFSAS